MSDNPPNGDGHDPVAADDVSDARTNEVGHRARMELLLTILLAAAGVLTAWAALQSTKWSGEQAIHFSEAGANRTESVRFHNEAAALIMLDVQGFSNWGQAEQAELVASVATGTSPPDATIYDPTNPTLSGYFFSLLREEFQPRVRIWLDGGGPANPSGSSPFVPYEEYEAETVPEAAESVRLAQVADEKAALARSDNQNSDDYVVTIVVLASVMFFSGVASQLTSRFAQKLLGGAAGVMLVWAVFRLATLPIHPIP